MTGRSRSRPPTERPGLQGERTELAWERSALGLMATAALLLFRHVGPTVGRVALVVLVVGLALLTIWFARRRGRRIRDLRTGPDGRMTLPDAGPEVLGAGLAAALISAGTVVLILFQT